MDKKIAILFMISFVFILYAHAQLVVLNNNMSLTFPSGSKKLNKEQVSLFADKKYDVHIINLNPKNVYQLNDMLLALYDFKGVSKETNLNGKKRI